MKLESIAVDCPARNETAELWSKPVIKQIDIKRTLGYKGSKTDGFSPTGSPFT